MLLVAGLQEDRPRRTDSQSWVSLQSNIVWRSHWRGIISEAFGTICMLYREAQCVLGSRGYNKKRDAAQDHSVPGGSDRPSAPVEIAICESAAWEVAAREIAACEIVAGESIIGVKRAAPSLAAGMCQVGLGCRDLGSCCPGRSSRLVCGRPSRSRRGTAADAPAGDHRSRLGRHATGNLGRFLRPAAGGP